MRLLMTTDTVGGVWTFTKELAAELLQRDHHVALVSIGPEPSSEQQDLIFACKARYADRFSFSRSPAPLEWMPENTAAYDAAKPLLMSVCREFKPDILLLNQFCFGALPVTQPKVVIAHSDVLSWAKAVCKAPLVEDKWLFNYRVLVQHGLHQADAVVAPTQFMLTALDDHFPMHCPTRVIPNGRSIPPGGEPTERKLQAITAGRLWDEAKNTRLLNDVDAPVPILIAGDGGTDTATGENSPHFLGKLPEPELLQQFRGSAIYICTSLYEPFGLAPLEAALCGCAVLAYDVPSLREVWAAGALYFKNVPSLTEMLQALKDNPEQLAAAQQRSGARAAQYTSARMAHQYLELATQLLAQHGRAVHAA